jgi:hypothetical protein
MVRHSLRCPRGVGDIPRLGAMKRASPFTPASPAPSPALWIAQPPPSTTRPRVTIDGDRVFQLVDVTAPRVHIGDMLAIDDHSHRFVDLRWGAGPQGSGQPSPRDDPSRTSSSPAPTTRCSTPMPFIGIEHNTELTLATALEPPSVGSACSA